MPVRASILLALLAAGCAAAAAPAPSPPEALAELDRRATAARPQAPEGTLGPEEAVTLALLLNPDLRAERRAAGVAEGEVVTAGLLPNPDLDVSLARVQGVGGGIANGTIEAALRLFPPRPGERGARVAAAQAGLEESRAGVEAAERDLAARVREAHAGWRAAEERLRLAGIARESAASLRAWAEGRARAGAASRLETLLTASDAAAAARDEREARSAVEAAREEVCGLLGLPPGTPLRPAPPAPGAGDPPPPEGAALDPLVAAALAARPEVRVARARLDRAEQELRLARLLRWPWPSLGPVFERDEGKSDRFGAGAGIALPLFDRAQGEVASREAARDAAREAYLARVHAVRAEVAAALRALLAAERARAAEEAEVLPPLEEALGLAEEGFRAGNLDLATLLAARDRVLRARSSHADRRLAAEKAGIGLDRARGLPAPAPAERTEEVVR